MVALLILCILVSAGLFARYLPIGEPNYIGAGPRLSPPTLALPLGTDELGRSFLPRIVHGIRTTFVLSASAVLVTAVLGSIIGMIAGYLGGIADRLIARGADVLFSFPAIVLGLLVAAIIGPGFLPTVLVVSFATLPLFVRVIRAVAMSVARREFVICAEVAGASVARVLFIHILPNILGAIIVQLTYALSIGMLIESGLSFLGLGTQPPDASLGSLLRSGVVYIAVAPWMALSAGLVLSLSIACINLAGDGMRDVIEPLRVRSLQ